MIEHVSWTAIFWFWFMIYCVWYIVDLSQFSNWTYKNHHRFQMYRIIIGGVIIALAASYLIGHMVWSLNRPYY